MKILFEIGQKLWDESSAREVEVIESNGSDYWCKTREGASDADAGRECLQWFTAEELRHFQTSI